MSGGTLGPFPTDAAWGATRGFFENLTVGTGGLDLLALHLAPLPLPSEGRWTVAAWSGKAVISRLQWARRAIKLNRGTWPCGSEPALGAVRSAMGQRASGRQPTEHPLAARKALLRRPFRLPSRTPTADVFILFKTFYMFSLRYIYVAFFLSKTLPS